MKVAIIIKHPFRDGDWRVDIVDVEADEPDYAEIRKQVEMNMLGPFEVVAITNKVNTDRKL